MKTKQKNPPIKKQSYNIKINQIPDSFYNTQIICEDLPGIIIDGKNMTIDFKGITKELNCTKFKEESFNKYKEILVICGHIIGGFIIDFNLKIDKLKTILLEISDDVDSYSTLAKILSQIEIGIQNQYEKYIKEVKIKNNDGLHVFRTWFMNFHAGIVQLVNKDLATFNYDMDIVNYFCLNKIIPKKGLEYLGNLMKRIQIDQEMSRSEKDKKLVR